MQKRKRRRSDRAGRPAMRSPGRPPVAGRGEQQRFWKAIARGLSSEDAAVSCGVSPPVGGRWVLPQSSVGVQSLTHLHARVWGRYWSTTVLSSTRPTHSEETTLSQSHVFLARKRRVQPHHPLRILQNHGRETASIPMHQVRTDVLDDKGHPLLPSPASQNNVRHGRHAAR